MNIQEAIKSGKRFRRPDWFEYCPAADLRNPDGYYEIWPDDLLADDFEVEEKSVTITREQFDAAWDNALPMRRNGWTERHRNALAEELGL